MRKHSIAAVLICLLLVPFGFCQNSPDNHRDLITLPAPSTTGGMALTEALAKRRSQRSFSATPLTQQDISQLLWAAQGITDKKGHRTAPSAMARYFLTVYLATAQGLFEYVPDGHKLRKVLGSDLRSTLSPPPSVSSAPAVFIITGDYDRAEKSLDRSSAVRCVDLEAGHATQNLLLQATAMNLSAVPVGGISPDEVAESASLPVSSHPIYLVPVGHPK